MTETPDILVSGELDEELSIVVEKAFTLGGEMMDAGDFAEAARVFAGLTELVPDNADVHNMLAAAFSASGNFSDAEKPLRQAIKLAPENTEYRMNLGAVYLTMGRLRKAMQEYASVMRVDASDMEAKYQYASTCRARGRKDEFEAQLREILETDPDHFSAKNDLGCHLIQTNRLDEGIGFLESILDEGSKNAVLLSNLGNAYLIKNRLEEAREMYLRAIVADPSAPSPHVGVATTERHLGLIDQALEHGKKAVGLNPGDPMVLNLMGTIRREAGQYDAAMRDFNKAIESDPHNAPAKTNRALLNLLLGNWQDGFTEYEARRDDPTYPKAQLTAPRPMWDGAPLEGRSVVCYAEQGFGDAIQFCRWIGTIEDSGGMASLLVPSALKRLFEGLDPQVPVFELGEGVPDVDLILPLMSLPHIVGLSGPDDVSGKAYLKAPDAHDDLRHALGDAKVKVGINWQGSPLHKEDRKRSIDPNQLAPLFAMDGIEFVSLHFGAQDSRLPEGLRDIGSHISDFADAASAVEELDLVISVDTATVHLAGALGVPTWCLVPFVPDWRWGLKGNTACWYDSLRLFRQAELGDWSGVIEMVKSALSEFLADRD